MIVLVTLLMLAVFGNLIGLALRLSWGIAKVLMILVFLPVILVGTIILGLVKLAIPVLLAVGIVSLIPRLKSDFADN